MLDMLTMLRLAPFQMYCITEFCRPNPRFIHTPTPNFSTRNFWTIPLQQTSACMTCRSVVPGQLFAHLSKNSKPHNQRVGLLTSQTDGLMDDLQ